MVRSSVSVRGPEVSYPASFYGAISRMKYFHEARLKGIGVHANLGGNDEVGEITEARVS